MPVGSCSFRIDVQHLRQRQHLRQHQEVDRFSRIIESPSLHGMGRIRSESMAAVEFSVV